MPLRLPCLRRAIPLGSFQRPYWPGGDFVTPTTDVYLVSGSAVVRIKAGIDTQSDFIACEYPAAGQLGVTRFSSRQVSFSGAGGAQVGTLSFPDDGIVGLFVTDFKEFCYLPASPVGFLPPTTGASRPRSVLGLTGFLQHFRFVLDPDPATPFFELHPRAGFPGQAGTVPKTVSLNDFIRGLYGP